AAAARPSQAETDILKIPFVAALLIVDDQVAVLQSDLIEILTVEPGQAQTVEPVEAGEQSARGRIRCSCGRRGRRRGYRRCGRSWGGLAGENRTCGRDAL